MKFDKFEDMLVWQKAKNLSKKIYKEFENSKDWGFKDQIQRAAVSIMNNIAEGYERSSNNEFKHFLFIAKGSCGETRSMLHLAKDLKKLSTEISEKLIRDSEEISKMLSGLIKTL
jgi:four helix bundle protein